MTHSGPLVLALLLASAVPSLATTSQATLVSGAWFFGKSPGIAITVRLHPEGMFTADWIGCLGRYGSASGTWTFRDGLIELQTTSATGLLQGYFGRLEPALTESPPRIYRLVPTEEGTWQRDKTHVFTRLDEGA